MSIWTEIEETIRKDLIGTSYLNDRQQKVASEVLGEIRRTVMTLQAEADLTDTLRQLLADERMKRTEAEMQVESLQMRLDAPSEEMRRAQAAAWAEGHDAGWEEREDFAQHGSVPSGIHQSEAINPYREEAPDA